MQAWLLLVRILSIRILIAFVTICDIQVNAQKAIDPVRNALGIWSRLLGRMAQPTLPTDDQLHFRVKEENLLGINELLAAALLAASTTASGSSSTWTTKALPTVTGNNQESLRSADLTHQNASSDTTERSATGATTVATAGLTTSASIMNGSDWNGFVHTEIVPSQSTKSSVLKHSSKARTAASKLKPSDQQAANRIITDLESIDQENSDTSSAMPDLSLSSKFSPAITSVEQTDHRATSKVTTPSFEFQTTPTARPAPHKAKSPSQIVLGNATLKDLTIINSDMRESIIQMIADELLHRLKRMQTRKVVEAGNNANGSIDSSVSNDNISSEPRNDTQQASSTDFRTHNTSASGSNQTATVFTTAQHNSFTMVTEKSITDRTIQSSIMFEDELAENVGSITTATKTYSIISENTTIKTDLLLESTDEPSLSNQFSSSATTTTKHSLVDEDMLVPVNSIIDGIGPLILPLLGIRPSSASVNSPANTKPSFDNYARTRDVRTYNPFNQKPTTLGEFEEAPIIGISRAVIRGIYDGSRVTQLQQPQTQVISDRIAAPMEPTAPALPAVQAAPLVPAATTVLAAPILSAASSSGTSPNESEPLAISRFGAPYAQQLPILARAAAFSYPTHRRQYESTRQLSSSIISQLGPTIGSQPNPDIANQPSSSILRKNEPYKRFIPSPSSYRSHAHHLNGTPTTSKLQPFSNHPLSKQFYNAKQFQTAQSQQSNWQDSTSTQSYYQMPQSNIITNLVSSMKKSNESYDNLIQSYPHSSQLTSSEQPSQQIKVFKINGQQLQEQYQKIQQRKEQQEQQRQYQQMQLERQKQQQQPLQQKQQQKFLSSIDSYQKIKQISQRNQLSPLTAEQMNDGFSSGRKKVASTFVGDSGLQLGNLDDMQLDAALFTPPSSYNNRNSNGFGMGGGSDQVSGPFQQEMIANL